MWFPWLARVAARARRSCALVAGLGLAGPGCASPPVATSPRSSPAQAAAARGAPAWTLDRSTFDPSVDPCDDFYQHVCGGWTRTPLPAGRTTAFLAGDALVARAQHTIEQLLVGGEPAGDPELQRLRTFYASCLAAGDARDRVDEPTLRRWLARIDGVTTSAQLQAVLRELQAAGVNAWLRYGPARDPANPARYRAEIAGGELGLRRDTYADPAARAVARRDAYRALIARVFELTGVAADRADRDARRVLEVEATLAAASPSAEQATDPALTEHVMAPEALRALAPHVDWAGYLALVGHPAGATLNATWPRYLQVLDQVLVQRPIGELRAALRWRLLDSLGDALPARLADARFRSRALPGEQPPGRADECQLATVKAMGVELSRQFARAIGPRSRASATRVAAGLRASIADQLDAAHWLSPAARAATADRIRKLELKIGYPDVWPATGEFSLRADAYLDNVIAARTFEQARIWQRARAAWRRADWEAMVYPNAAPGIAAARLTIPNGFPDVFSNSIIVTAAGLSPPAFDPAAPLEVQYATFGTLVGHELVHMIEAHEWDANGELYDPWSPADVSAHAARRTCVVEQADRFVVFGTSHADGADTVDENVADLSGLGFAYAALARELGARLAQPGRDGVTPAQRFFFAHAQKWCTAQTPEAAEADLRTDHHGPPRFRVDGPLMNMPEFAAAFSCPAGARMVRPDAERCRVW
ncbi:MAG TPA: M13 family metallopeptidase [Kofleriaceae bacterium]|jgi:predicted metalloendopeptidase